MDMTSRRSVRRVECHIDVQVVHPVESQKGIVMDISEGGAKIAVLRPMRVGSKIVIDCNGHSAWANVRWAESDRIGVDFDVPLASNHPFMAVIAASKTSALPIPANNNQRSLSFGRRAA